jgi:hypothetical protein
MAFPRPGGQLARLQREAKAKRLRMERQIRIDALREQRRLSRLVRQDCQEQQEVYRSGPPVRVVIDPDDPERVGVIPHT